MRYEFQVDGRTGSVFIKSVTLVPKNIDPTQYERRVGVTGMIVQEGKPKILIYSFDGVDDTRVGIYLMSTSFENKPAVVASALAYDPETPDEMLEELMELADLEETDDVPNDFTEWYETVLKYTLEKTVERVEGKV